jgi:arabinogalactan endo-1,4-beta-galactosidase
MTIIVTLHDEKIIDHWRIVVEDGEGNAEQIYEDTEDYVKETRAPGIEIERVRISTSWLAGFLGNSRNYMKITNRNLRDFRMFIGAWDYGQNLSISWYLTCEPGFFKRMLSKILTRGASDRALSFGLNLFRQEALNNYATLVHHCLMKAIEKLMGVLGQDFSEIDKKSRGFLGIS